MRFDVHGLGIRGGLDLARGRVEEGRVEGVFIGLDLDLPPTEAPVKVRLAGVFSALHVRVAAGTPVRVLGAGLPFNAIDRGVPGADGKAGYEIKVDGIFTAVTVDTRPETVHSVAPPGPRIKPETGRSAAAGARPPAEATPSPFRH